MNWTFGIVTDGKNEDRVDKIIKSIEANNIPESEYEIIIVGPDFIIKHYQGQCSLESFEKVKEAHITRKKNIICKEAKFNNIVLMHDYFSLEPNFYKGFETFGEDWDVAMCKIKTIDNNRFRDWVLYDCNCEAALHPHAIMWLSYDDDTQTNNQYLSGGFYIIKKDFALKHPLDESRCWGEREDTAWALTVRKFWKLKMNKLSSVKLLKDKGPIHPPYTAEFGWKDSYGQ